MKNIVLLIVAISTSILLLTGCINTPPPEPIDAKTTLKNCLDDLINGNYDAAFKKLVNSTGQPFPPKVKENITSVWEKASLNQYEILNESDAATELLQKTPFTEGKQYTVEINSSTEQIESISKTKYFVVKYKGEWKVFSPSLSLLQSNNTIPPKKES